MKIIKNISKLLKSNIKIVIIFNIQLFFVLFFTITSINEYRESVKVYNKGLNSKLKYAIYYMGKVPYGVKKYDKEINNNDEVMKSKILFEKFYNDNIDYFDGRLLGSKVEVTIFDENGEEKNLSTFDRTTMEILLNNNINSYLINKITDTNIPVLVNDKYKNNYKLNDKITIKSFNQKDFTLEIVGYYNEDNIFNVRLDVMTNGAPKLSELIESMNKSSENKFIALQEGNYLKDLTANYSFGEPSRMILYTKKEYFNDILEKLKTFSEKNDIGYYSLLKDSIEKEKESIKMERLKFLDFSIALYSIIILSIIAIGYINTNILKKRYKIYHINGASRIKLYLTTFFYYIVQFYVPIFLYTIFIEFAKSDFVRKYLSKNLLFTMIMHGKFNIDLLVFSIMSVAIITISGIISYLPLVKLKERKKINDWNKRN